MLTQWNNLIKFIGTNVPKLYLLRIKVPTSIKKENFCI